jgi:hypothetical protein
VEAGETVNQTRETIDETYLMEVYRARGGGGQVNMPSEFERVEENIKSSLLQWIKTYIIPAKTFDPDNTSYGLKHKFEDDTGHYVSNGAFKGAMLHLGFRPEDVKDINWNFNSRLSRQWVKDARASGRRVCILRIPRD